MIRKATANLEHSYQVCDSSTILAVLLQQIWQASHGLLLCENAANRSTCRTISSMSNSINLIHTAACFSC